MASPDPNRSDTTKSWRKPLVAFDDLQWFDCRVEEVGPDEYGRTLVLMSDVGDYFHGLWFRALDMNTSEVLHTALTALQSDLTVHVGLSDEGEIYRMHAKRTNP